MLNQLTAEEMDALTSYLAKYEHGMKDFVRTDDSRWQFSSRSPLTESFKSDRPEDHYGIFKFAPPQDLGEHQEENGRYLFNDFLHGAQSNERAALERLTQAFVIAHRYRGKDEEITDEAKGMIELARRHVAAAYAENGCEPAEAEQIADNKLGELQARTNKYNITRPYPVRSSVGGAIR